MNKKINEIFPHEDNPRFIRNEKYLEQKKSIVETPEMMNLRPVIINENNIILGGHQRWRACKELGWKEVPVMILTREMHLKSESWLVYGKTYEEVESEVVIKDNTHYGEFDYDILANKWDDLPLVEYGVNIWQPEKELDLTDFFSKPENIPDKSNGLQITLEYDQEKYNNLIEIFKNYDGSKEELIYDLVTNEK